MSIQHRTRGPFVLGLCAAVCALTVGRPSEAEAYNEADRPAASIAEQEEIGLVLLATDLPGCVGTLLNQYWVLTSDDCVIRFQNGWAGLQPAAGRPNKPPAEMKITAAWHSKTVTPTRSVRYWNSDNLNVALLFLGKGDFGSRDRRTRLIFHDPIDTGVLLTKFSRDNTKKFTPVVANETSVELDRLTFLEPGSPGGPDYLTAANDALLSIASVTSQCNFGNDKRCLSTPLFSLRDDILARMKETPPPPDVERAMVSNDANAAVADALGNPKVDVVSNQPGVADILTNRNAAAVSDENSVSAVMPHDSFTGVWATVTGGRKYTMRLTQKGVNVSGSYTSDVGGVTGTIEGELVRASGSLLGVLPKPVYSRSLAYRWTEGGGSKGSGKFTLAGDGNSFEGWWNSGDDPNVAQTGWTGTRK